VTAQRSAGWLLPSPHETPGDDAAYWPDTCFTVLPQSRWSEQQQAAIEAGELTGDFLEYAALGTHEQTHWIQAHAFGYGRFLARIDHARSEIAESFIGMFPADWVQRLLERRLVGHAVTRLEGGLRVVRRPEFGPIGVRLQHHWWSLGALRRELEDSDRELGSLESSALRYGLAVLYAEVGPSVSEVALLPARQLRDLAFERAPQGSYAQALAQSAYPELSGAAIAECSAVLSQHWAYAHATEMLRRRGDASAADRMHRTHVRSWQTKEPTFYGNAFRAYAHFCPNLDLNAARPLLTLGIACCLAMDGNYGPECSGPATWLDVSPPLRFLRLMRAVRKVGVVATDVLCDMPARKLHRYCDDLTAAAGLPEPRRRAARIRTTASETSPIDALRELLNDAHAASIRLRRSLPAALIAPAETTVHRAEALVEGPLAEFSLARLPPLMSVGGRSVPVGISDARFADCAVGGAYQRLLLQLLGNTATFSFAGLPSDATGIAAARRALELLRERTERPVEIAMPV
jgi:hypothetical protein